MLLHQICHNEIHATLTEAELARHYDTVAALKAHPQLQAFYQWVAGKDPHFYARSVGGRRPRRPR